jgi:YHYH protein
MKQFVCAASLVALNSSCSATTQPGASTDAAVLDAGQMDSGPASSACPTSLPICNAFRNDGKYGGRVSVTVSSDQREAVVRSNDLANHPMGAYGPNPNKALPQSFEFRIPLTFTDGPSRAGFGHVGVAFNGVSLFNPQDARDIGGCTGNAAYIESDQVDAYGGHPTPNSEYHYHTGDFLKKAAELGLRGSVTEHSSLVGYAFDGVPIYGPFGFVDGQAATGGVREMRSCYRKKAARTCCIAAARCAPAASFEGKALVLGAFVEDFEFDQEAFTKKQCDLDTYNSRVTVTPEYGTPVRAYFMTFDEDGRVTFPFIFGTQYAGRATPNR